MEPLTIIAYVLTSFFGYYIGSDISNSINLRSELQEINNSLHLIHRHLQFRK